MPWMLRGHFVQHAALGPAGEKWIAVLAWICAATLYSDSIAVDDGTAQLSQLAVVWNYGSNGENLWTHDAAGRL